MFVMKTTPEREQASLKFLEYVLSEEFQTELSLKIGFLPINIKSRNSKVYRKFVAKQPEMKVFLEQMNSARSRPIIAGYTRLSENLGRAIEETLLFIEREMTSQENGFYSALDADSEGIEGKYYTWQKTEIDAILKDDADLFCRFYDITDHGNWEEVNIPRTRQTAQAFCAENGLDLQDFEKSMRVNLDKLHAVRQKRIRPLLDDKIILGWNALMNSAYCKAFAALGNEGYRTKAISNMKFLLEVFPTNDGYWHVYKEGLAKYPAFLDDYAYLIQSLLHLQEITADTSYLGKAGELIEYVAAHFSEQDTGYFFFTKANQSDIVVRKKEVYDGAVPSGNAVMAVNLNYLGIVFNRQDWRERSGRMLLGLQDAVLRYPGSFGVWAGLFLNNIYGFRELAIIGEGYQMQKREVLGWFVPNLILQSSAKKHSSFPLLSDRDSPASATFFYLCKNYACYKPTAEMQEIRALLAPATG